MSELIEIGGIQPLMKVLLDVGLLHGDCLTVTGKTMAENLADVDPYPEGQDIIRKLEDPIKKDSHLVVLYGNLAPTVRWRKFPARKVCVSVAMHACLNQKKPHWRLFSMAPW